MGAHPIRVSSCGMLRLLFAKMVATFKKGSPRVCAVGVWRLHYMVLFTFFVVHRKLQERLRNWDLPIFSRNRLDPDFQTDIYWLFSAVVGLLRW